MKDHRLLTSFENYEAFDVIAGSNYGVSSERDIACDLADFLRGSINTHADYDGAVREVAECGDDDLPELVEDLSAQLSEIVSDDSWHTLEWRDNEFIVTPAIESCLEDHREDERVSEELPEPDSTHTIGSTWMTVNERGNTSLYRFEGTVAGWHEIWAVV